MLVVRTADGEIKGFLNNCRHRASGLLFDPAGNCGSSMTCPYHNWAYNLDGHLIGIPDKARMYPDGVDMGELGLVPIRIEVAWNKLVFGCLSHKAPSFREWIAPIADRYDSYKFGVVSRVTTASSTRSIRSTGRRSPRTRTTTTTFASCTAG